MRQLNDDEQMWLDEYIRDEFGLDDAGAGVSEEMRMAIAESFEFQVYLLKKNWIRFCEEITTSFIQILQIFRLHK